MKEQILTLLRRHLSSLGQESRLIAAEIARVEALPPEDLTVLHRRVHTLKGSSGSLGFMAVHRAAEALEFALRDRLEKGTAAAPLDRLDALEAQLRTTVLSLEIEDSTLWSRFA